MYHNLYKRKFQYTAISMALALAGCGGGEGDKSNNNSSPEFVAPSTISAQNATFVTEYGDHYIVDLSDKVSVSGGNDFQLLSVDSLTQSAECEPLEQLTQGFVVSADSAKSCDYEYEVAVIEASAASIAPVSLTGAPSDVAITRVAVVSEAPANAEELSLPAISEATLVETLIEVDVEELLLIQTGTTIGTDFTLNDALTLPYSENTATANQTTNTISYTPTSGFEGIERILFSYTNSVTGDVLLGTLDIAVSHSANQGLTIADDITHEEVAINEVVTIDVSPYVTSHDGDDYQLIYVDSFNAATEPLDPVDVTNKSFTFETSRMGNHYVSFAVSDHNGAYEMGLMEVPAFDPSKAGQWDGIFYEGLYFSEPLTTQEAASKEITYNDTLVDNFYSPEVNLALFSTVNALNYCGLQGRLPTSEELNVLSSQSVQTNHNWPISEQYMANDDGTYKTVDLATGIVSEYLGGNYIVSCIEGGLTVQPPAGEIIANGINEAQVVFTLLGEDEEPIVGPAINFTVRDSNQAALTTLSEATDVNGLATALVTNIKAEEVTVCGEVGIQNTCAIVTFTGDLATAEVVAVRHDVSSWSSGSSENFPVIATVKDINNNAVPDAEVTMEQLENAFFPALNMSINAFTNDVGEAELSVQNLETNVWDRTVLRVSHTNPSSVTTWLDQETFWELWQWSTPINIKITSFWDSNLDDVDGQCETEFGVGYRGITIAELEEYENALETDPLLMSSNDADPLLFAIESNSRRENGLMVPIDGLLEDPNESNELVLIYLLNGNKRFSSQPESVFRHSGTFESSTFEGTYGSFEYHRLSNLDITTKAAGITISDAGPEMVDAHAICVTPL
ncbi:Ig-like domain-containing protein [Vibrio owensii]|uniref:Ig-like domain-containing protein n=1 Tax=Vibrio owensii TaxID=696485 RepID=UPI0003AAE605|nr:hypothetical protein [Vibrio owensii]